MFSNFFLWGGYNNDKTFLICIVFVLISFLAGVLPGHLLRCLPGAFAVHADCRRLCPGEWLSRFSFLQ